MIFANKQDVQGALNKQQIAEVLGLQQQQQEQPTSTPDNNNNNDNNNNSNSNNDNSENNPTNIGSHRHWNIVACSAVTGEGLLEGIDWLVEDIASRLFLLE